MITISHFAWKTPLTILQKLGKSHFNTFQETIQRLRKDSVTESVKDSHDMPLRGVCMPLVHVPHDACMHEVACVKSDGELAMSNCPS